MRNLVRVLYHFVFDCHHRDLSSRVFTMGGRSYRVCFDCGEKIDYSWETMSLVRRRRLGHVPATLTAQLQHLQEARAQEPSGAAQGAGQALA